MNAPLDSQARLNFDDLPQAAGHHFRLAFFAGVLGLLGALARQPPGLEALLERYAGLRDYLDEMDRPGLDGLTLEQAWSAWTAASERWAAAGSDDDPLSRLGTAHGLDAADLSLLCTVGLVEEDARFASLFADQCGQPRPTLGWLAATHPVLESDDTRRRLARLLDLGLLESEAQGARAGWTLAVPLPVWDGLHGWMSPADGLRLLTAEGAPRLDELVLAPSLRTALADWPGSAQPLALRGLARSGRLTLAHALAAAAGHDLLVLSANLAADVRRCRQAARQADCLGAWLAVDGREHADGLTAANPMTFLLLPEIGGEPPVSCRVLHLDMPAPAQRAALLARACGQSTEQLADLAQAHRLPAGCWLSLARACGDADHSRSRLAERLLNLSAPALEEGAQRLPARGDWSELALPEHTSEELAWLEARCRQREALSGHVGASLAADLTPGVRALFKGPSGTGKTAAARILAARLGKPAFRVDLARTVSKYIGETEKNLARLFAAARAIDAVLLLDEGDALMAGRTGVSNANDRYANLETNYLLQAVERHEGILLVTSNAADRIDKAFRRRLDVVIDFPAPDAAARVRILAIHLPAEHRVSAGQLERLATRCALNGGQWRNVVLHAALMALEAGRLIADADLEAALRREYRKLGQVCPLRGEPV